MKKLAAALVCVTLLGTLSWGPWQHVHAHGHDEHHAGAALHVHNAPVSATPWWRTHGPDEDARRISGVLATSAAGHAGYLIALVPTLPALQAPSPRWRGPALSPSRGHDPPLLSATRSRAPPA